MGQRPEQSRHADRKTTAVLTHSSLLLLGVFLGVMFEPIFGQVISWAEWHITSAALPGTAKPSCEDPGWYRQVTPVDADSYYFYRGDEEFSGDNYLATKTLDNSRTTAWVAPFHSTDEDWIAWDFAGEVDVDLMCIRNGYTKSYTTYAGNGRVLAATIEGCGESHAVEFEDHVDLESRVLLDGWDEYEEVPLDCQTSRVRLLPTQTADAYDNSTLVAVSDVKFYRGFSMVD